MNYRFLLCIIILLSSFKINSQINQLGNPFIRNYSIKEYKGNNQNWHITKDLRGIMYFEEFKEGYEREWFNLLFHKDMLANWP